MNLYMPKYAKVPNNCNIRGKCCYYCIYSLSCTTVLIGKTNANRPNYVVCFVKNEVSSLKNPNKIIDISITKSLWISRFNKDPPKKNVINADFV